MDGQNRRMYRFRHNLYHSVHTSCHFSYLINIQNFVLLSFSFAELTMATLCIPLFSEAESQL
jgi:hypothetical protein